MNSIASGEITPISAAVFLKLVNHVLEGIGRDVLPTNGAHHRIICVTPKDSVLQILAGPGSGKTEALVWRVLYELFVNGVASQKVMVTTFTRRAATELQVRLVERSDALQKAGKDRGVTIGDPKVHDLRIGTIHSLCDSLLAEFDTTHMECGTQVVDDAEVTVRIVRDHRYSLGYSNPPNAPRLLNRLLTTPDLTFLFRPTWDDSVNWPSSMMERAHCIVAILNQHTETWIPRCATSSRPNGIETTHGPVGLTADLVKLQQRWEEYLDKHNILDFATIQKRFLERQQLIADHISHVFVDEFQDNNPIQFAIHTGWLSKPHVKLTVVGDDDQALYRFRGSDIACFNELKPFCAGAKIPYRTEKLETNYRSTKRIVTFSQIYRSQSVLGSLSMPKTITAAKKAPKGDSVRLLTGPWDEISRCVASELKKLGAGVIPSEGHTPPSAAVLMFSTSERSSRTWTAPASVLRRTLESAGIRTYNPRNKMAAAPESPVSQLLGLISYLIDPITFAPAGKNGRQVMVSASMREANKRTLAAALPPPFGISEAHLDFQKRLFKTGGGDIGSPPPKLAPVIALVDNIRRELIKTCGKGEKPRLTLAGFVSRVLACPYFRQCGFTPALFRQALFTELLEANIAPTRLTMKSLDQPLDATTVNGKVMWSDRFWSLLNVFGAYLNDAPVDDPEVESFEENAVMILTFHQTKGLEFDHVYVAGTGRTPDLGPALRTKLFSGEKPRYRTSGPLASTDKDVCALALADRDREVYVALTRAKKSLTLMCDPQAELYMSLNPAIQKLFPHSGKSFHPASAAVSITEYADNE